MERIVPGASEGAVGKVEAGGVARDLVVIVLAGRVLLADHSLCPVEDRALTNDGLANILECSEVGARNGGVDGVGEASGELLLEEDVVPDSE